MLLNNSLVMGPLIADSFSRRFRAVGAQLYFVFDMLNRAYLKFVRCATLEFNDSKKLGIILVGAKCVRMLI